jgi:uncharacterized protein (TIGR00251 family)
VSATTVPASIAVRVQPGARRDEIFGVREGVLMARVGAPAVEGRANHALCRLIASRLGVRRSQVSIVRGERSRNKLVCVEGIDDADIEDLFGIAG